MEEGEGSGGAGGVLSPLKVILGQCLSRPLLVPQADGETSIPPKFSGCCAQRTRPLCAGLCLVLGPYRDLPPPGSAPSESLLPQARAASGARTPASGERQVLAA